jgi:hypothetical protein
MKPSGSESVVFVITSLWFFRGEIAIVVAEKFKCGSGVCLYIFLILVCVKPFG